MSMQAVTVRIKAKLADQIDALAGAEQRTRSNMVARLLGEALAARPRAGAAADPEPTVAVIENTRRWDR